MNRETREVEVKSVTFELLWEAAQCQQLAASQFPHKAAYFRVSAMVLACFTLEAYLNHLWLVVFQDEHGDEKDFFAAVEQEKYKATLGKLDFMIQSCGEVFPKGQRPYQTIKRLDVFRRHVVHGRTEQFRMRVPIGDDGYPKLVEPEFYKFVSEENVERSLFDTRGVIVRLNAAMRKAHEEADIEDHPLRGFFGSQIG